MTASEAHLLELRKVHSMLHGAMDALINDLNPNEAARLLILLDDRLTSLINASESDGEIERPKPDLIIRKATPAPGGREPLRATPAAPSAPPQRTQATEPEPSAPRRAAEPPRPSAEAPIPATEPPGPPPEAAKPAAPPPPVPPPAPPVPAAAPPIPADAGPAAPEDDEPDLVPATPIMAVPEAVPPPRHPPHPAASAGLTPEPRDEVEAVPPPRAAAAPPPPVETPLSAASPRPTFGPPPRPPAAVLPPAFARPPVAPAFEPPSEPAIFREMDAEEAAEPADEPDRWEGEDAGESAAPPDEERPRQGLAGLLSRFRLPGFSRRRDEPAEAPEVADASDGPFDDTDPLDETDIVDEEEEEFEDDGEPVDDLEDEVADDEPAEEPAFERNLMRLHAAVDQLASNHLLDEAAARTGNRIELRKVADGLDLAVKGLPMPLGTIRISEADGHVLYHPKFGLDLPHREPNRADLEIWMKAMDAVVVRVLEDIAARRNKRAPSAEAEGGT